MSVRYGFFNSNNGDRVYDANDFSTLFKMVVPGQAGYFSQYESQTSDILKVTAVSGLQVHVNTGMAWLYGTWTINDSILLLTAEAADVGFARYDAVVIKSDQRTSGRKNTIEIVKGSASPSPTYPDLSPADNVYYLPLAYIYRPAGSTSIVAGNITNNHGTSQCPEIPYMPSFLAEVSNKIDEFEEELSTASLMTESRVRAIVDEEIGTAVNATY